DGVEIIVDKDTFRSGQTAPVMLFVDEPDRHVLFSVEGEDLYSYQLIHVTGTTKLIELPITEKHVPNIYLSAFMINDAQAYMDTKQVIVPPVQNFLAVDVKADREQYQPREEGTLSITTRDANGKPVAAEVALGLVDESIKYIQQDYAGDPRQFYFGTKRSHMVQTQTTFSNKVYAKLIEIENGQLIDRREAGQNEEDEYRKLELQGRYDRGPVGRMAIDGVDAEFGGARAANAPMSMSDSASVVGGMANRVVAQPISSVKDTAKLKSPAEAPPPPQPGQEPAVQVRSDFRSTIIWQPDIVTDANGNAAVKVTYPDSLTTWSATARVGGYGNQFGIGSATTRTKQPLIVRLQAPRFFVV